MKANSRGAVVGFLVFLTALMLMGNNAQADGGGNRAARLAPATQRASRIYGPLPASPTPARTPTKKTCTVYMGAWVGPCVPYQETGSK